MAHAIWSGSISFGLVNIPVRLYSATNEKSIRFNQFEEGTADRVRNLRVNERTGEEVEYSKIVKGYDVGGSEYVIVSQEELDEISPKRSQSIEISDFVELAEIDPVFFRTAYVLGPANASAQKAYGLLLRAMSESGRVGVSTFVMRGKEYLCVVRANGDALLLETLYFADELREPVEVLDKDAEIAEPTERELQMALQLVETLSAEWEPEQYKDSYRFEVEALIDRKRAGASLVTNVKGEQVEMAPIVDLMEALRASVSGAKPKAPKAPKQPAEAQPKKTARAREVAKSSTKATTARAPKRASAKAPAAKTSARRRTPKAS